MARLEYDDSAFLYFAITILLVVLLPATVAQLRALFGSDGGAAGEFKARTSVERKVPKRFDAIAGSTKSDNASWKLYLLCLGWALVAFLAYHTGDSAQIQQFDPWEVLGVSKSATEKEIRSAYRKKSMLYHPDKNERKAPDERALAAQMLEKVQNAHVILTNEEAFKNFKATGSADGGGQMQVSIGLPKMLIDKRNQNIVLVAYLLVLTIIIPAGGILWYQRSKRFGDKMILNYTYQVYLMFMENKTRFEQMPEILALSGEYRETSAHDVSVLNELRKKMISEHMMPGTAVLKDPIAKQKFKQYPACARTSVLLYAHLNRMRDELTPALRDDLDQILLKSEMLINVMVETASLRRNFHALREVINFEQRMTQALWVLDSDMQQIPHFSRVEAKQATIGKSPVKNLGEFLRSNDVDPENAPGKKKGMMKFTNEQVEDVRQFLKIAPNVEFRVTVGVLKDASDEENPEWEEFGCEGDVMTAFFEIERKNVFIGSKDAVGPVHAPYLPFLKAEKFSIIMCQKGSNNVMAHQTAEGSERILRSKIQFPSNGYLTSKKPMSFDFHLISHSYIGIDLMVSRTVTVKAKGTVPPLEYTEEDIRAAQEPSIFEEAFGSTRPDPDSDFEDSDDESSKPK